MNTIMYHLMTSEIINNTNKYNFFKLYSQA
jgi:hypothetical protein